MMRLFILACISGLWLWAADCSSTTIGLQPLNAPFFREYRGMEGGLYPGRTNARPLNLELRGRAAAAQVTPLNAAGAVDETGGRVALISIGMSNTTQEFSAFQQLAAADPTLHPRLLLVDGAQGGWSADQIVADPEGYFSGVAQRLARERASAQQVQAAWVKLADRQPTLPFPDDARKLRDETRAIIGMLRARFPNLRLVYLSSRIYAGYASTTLNPEPHAYHGGFAVRWLIDEQLRGEVPAVPFLSWGPYLWADGVEPRADGLHWRCDDLADDGTHPSPAGRLKVARMLLDFFKSDTTSRPWFVAGVSPPERPPRLQAMVNAASYGDTVAPGAIATIFGEDLAEGRASATAYPLPYGLLGTRVTVGGAPAPLYAVGPGQINLVVPPDAAGNTVVVMRERLESAALSAQAALNSLGLFSLDGSGQGPAAALHAGGRVVSAQAPARRGETIELFGTGKGLRNPMILAPEVLPSVRVGGALADVHYYGPAPGITGLDQLNITIPPDAPPGAAVPVRVQLGSFVSNTVTLAIAP
jgi:uncharacterized protein (TIGR03437 family)